MKIIFDEFQIEITAAQDGENIFDKIGLLLELPSVKALLERVIEIAEAMAVKNLNLGQETSPSETWQLTESDIDLIDFIDAFCNDEKVVVTDALITMIKTDYPEQYELIRNITQLHTLFDILLTTYTMLPEDHNPLIDLLNVPAMQATGIVAILSNDKKMYLAKLSKLYTKIKTDTISDENEQTE